MRKPSFSLPLGIGTANWLRDPQLLATGGFGLAMLPRDMAKIGYLYLRNGQWGKIGTSSARLDRQGVPRHCGHETFSRAGPAILQFFLGPAQQENLYGGRISLPTHRGFSGVGHRRGDDGQRLLPFSKLADYVSGAVESKRL
jgi:hypothetical protein